MKCLVESDNEDTKTLRHFTITWLKELQAEIDRLEKENEELKVISGAKMLEILRLQKAVPLLVQAQPPQSISPEELINWLRKRDDIIEGSRL